MLFFHILDSSLLAESHETVPQAKNMAALRGFLFLFTFYHTLQFSEPRSFTIDYERNCFLKDGKEFRYISGSFHYFRVPRFYWKDRLLKMKAGGLNAIQTYVAWNVHEPIQGKYNFDGNADLVSFIKLAQSLDLLVIVRAGPYICAEWDFGGFPAWLLKNTSIVLRSSKDKRYISAVDSWMSVLLPQLQQLLYQNGGPIISVQVENEYGSYIACDLDYLKHLEEIFRRYLRFEVILFTVDSDEEFLFKCGTIPSLYATVDFGPEVNPENSFAVMRKFSPKGPLVNSEFYTGWLDHWGEKHQTKSAATVAKSLDKILSMNASVNFYMYEGGTNFGFMNGASFDFIAYQPNPTSYDYDAPLTEAGDATTKFHILRETISKHEKFPITPVPANTTKFAFGRVQMTRLTTFLDVLPKLSASLGPINATLPLTMEQIGQNYGFAVYRTQIPKRFAQSKSVLNITNLVRDRAIIFAGKIRQATLFRGAKETSVSIIIGNYLQLDILVENMGRVNFGAYMCDPKGILGNVTLDGVQLFNWQMYPTDLNKVISGIGQFEHGLYLDDNMEIIPKTENSFSPSFFYGEIQLPLNLSYPLDTFLQLPGWSKGQAFINGYNLGRYWPAVGPQETLFVPGNLLSPSPNSIHVVLLELDSAPCEFSQSCFIEFVATPVLNGTVHPIGNKALSTL